MVIEVKLLQKEKAELPIDVTPLGIVMEVKLLQPEKAFPPIDVTLLGMMIVARLLQPQKARLLIFCKPSPSTTDVRPKLS